MWWTCKWHLIERFCIHLLLLVTGTRDSEFEVHGKVEPQSMLSKLRSKFFFFSFFILTLQLKWCTLLPWKCFASPLNWNSSNNYISLTRLYLFQFANNRVRVDSFFITERKAVREREKRKKSWSINREHILDERRRRRRRRWSRKRWRKRAKEQVNLSM